MSDPLGPRGSMGGLHNGKRFKRITRELHRQAETERKGRENRRSPRHREDSEDRPAEAGGKVDRCK